ncbi:hypothetical protein [Burkholderia cenocepacia]|uniref:hypothetical protein n=1 Tax=Burkholderia cenocepacia TaxID=95486 RepID=UPI002654BA14|nr:hypothetical protein [Burkholderia cenocepacia]MDN7536790.1 hypothetical protein [Burkholderia cenocepacia]
MQDFAFDRRTEYRFTGHNGKVYGRGLTEAAAINDAQETLGEFMPNQAAIDENGYVVAVTQYREATGLIGEWRDGNLNAKVMMSPEAAARIAELCKNASIGLQACVALG